VPNVDTKLRWQALQARLTATRAFVAAGDRARALEEITAALEIDPEFLAAQTFRDRLVSGDLIPLVQTPQTSSAVASTAASGTAAEPRPHSLDFADGYTRFEERAKRRRVDRQLEAAQVAIERHRLQEAAAALDEVIELDPNVPELAALTSAFDNLHRSMAHAERGPWIAAAVVFAVMVLGASWIEDQGGDHAIGNIVMPLWSRPILVLTALVQPPPPAPLVTTTTDSQPEPSDTPRRAVRESDAPEPTLAPRPSAPSGSPVELMNAPPLTEPARPSSVPSPAEHAAALPLAAVLTPTSPANPPVPSNLPVPVNPPVPANLPAVDRPLNPSTPSNAESTGSVAKPKADDELLVKQALQRYRVAYEGLDARSAQAVWPAVNQAALARAFGGLASQRLTFDSCDVQLRGETATATATCHGTARYVPKIGGGEPRTEPRVWNFTLRKSGTDWKIDTAQVGR
jgi:tetratricopeptide (TPR) repeat protein